MIATITLNPSVDKRYIVADLVKGMVIRVAKVDNTAGGKGLNVSRVIRLLGEAVTATGFLGGGSGEFIAEQLREQGIQDKFVRIDGQTRNCLAIIGPDDVQTELLEPGPVINPDELQQLFSVYDKMLANNRFVCASGSLPANLPVTIYQDLIRRANDKQVPFFLDTSGEALRAGIADSPFFIKPNLQELEFIAQKALSSQAEVLKQIDTLQQQGIGCVFVSLGKNGALVGLNGKKYKVIVPSVKALNPVGSGDALVAGFVVGMKRGFAQEEVIAFACACGTANALEEPTGFVREAIVRKLYNCIKVTNL